MLCLSHVWINFVATGAAEDLSYLSGFLELGRKGISWKDEDNTVVI